MTVENANAFLDELKANGPSAKLMSKIGKDFQPEHMQEALKAKELNHEEILKQAAGPEVLPGLQVEWLLRVRLPEPTFL